MATTVKPCSNSILKLQVAKLHTLYPSSLHSCLKPPPLTNFLPKDRQYRHPTQAVVCISIWDCLLNLKLYVCGYINASRQDIISRIQEYNLYKETLGDKLTTKEVRLYCFDNNSSVLFSLSLSLSLPLPTPTVSLAFPSSFLNLSIPSSSSQPTCVTIFHRSTVVFTLKVCWRSTGVFVNPSH